MGAHANGSSSGSRDSEGAGRFQGMRQQTTPSAAVCSHCSSNSVECAPCDSAEGGVGSVTGGKAGAGRAVVRDNVVSHSWGWGGQWQQQQAAADTEEGRAEWGAARRSELTAAESLGPQRVGGGERGAAAASSAEVTGWQQRIGDGGDRGAVRRVIEGGRGARRGGMALPKRVLHLFAGPERGEGSFTEACAAVGWEVREIDVEQGGGGHDLCDDAVFEVLLAQVRRGEFGAVVAGIPCSTFSVARLRPGPARPLRGRRGQTLGLPGLTSSETWRVHEANVLAARAAALCEEVAIVGGDFVVENPIDRGDPGLRWVYSEPDHCPLWQLPVMQRLERVAAGKRIHFPQCAFAGAQFQKWTTLLVSAGSWWRRHQRGTSCGAITRRMRRWRQGMTRWASRQGRRQRRTRLV